MTNQQHMNLTNDGGTWILTMGDGRVLEWEGGEGLDLRGVAVGLAKVVVGAKIQSIRGLVRVQLQFGLVGAFEVVDACAVTDEDEVLARYEQPWRSDLAAIVWRPVSSLQGAE